MSVICSRSSSLSYQSVLHFFLLAAGSRSTAELGLIGCPAHRMRNQECVSFGRGSVQQEVKGDTSLKTITINTPDHISSTVTLKLHAVTHPCSMLLFLRGMELLSRGFLVEKRHSERRHVNPLTRVWKTTPRV